MGYFLFEFLQFNTSVIITQQEEEYIDDDDDDEDERRSIINIGLYLHHQK